MNGTTAICLALLKGEVLTIKTAFSRFGISNLPRECGRAVERKFGVELSRVRREGRSRYDVSCTWYEYRLPIASHNEEGRAKMIEYCSQHAPNEPIQSKPITVKEHTRKKASDTVEGEKVNNLKLFDL